jgi:hypothetical protein
VNTGTINDVELLARSIELASPDAVCTDRPAELRIETMSIEPAASTAGIPDAELVSA